MGEVQSVMQDRGAGGAAIRACGDRIDPFVARHFGLQGTLRLHGAALGGDMLRAPANLCLAPVHALLRLLALLLGRLGAVRAADWLRGRRILLRTRVGARVEEVVITDLLGLEWPQAPGMDHAVRLRHAIMSAPQLRETIRAQDDPQRAGALADRLARQIEDYAGTRTAVAEIVTALVLLILGAVLFRVMTPGMISLAPNVAGAVAHGVAVSEFPLGETLGGLWYGVFPVGVPGWLIGTVVLVLVMVGAAMAAFAGILADPVQRRLGLHHRRLQRLLGAMAVTLDSAGEGGFATPEHAMARVFDLWDLLGSLLRVFRG